MSDGILHPVSDAAFAFARRALWLARDFEEPLGAALVPGRWDVAAVTGGGAAVPNERLERFDAGGLGAGRANVAGVVVEAWREAPGATFVAVDGMGKEGDPFLTGVTTPYVFVERTIVYPVPVPDRAAVERAWDAGASAAGQMGFLTTRAPTAPRGGHEDLAAMVAGATLVVLTAYDGEGAVVFRRRSGPLNDS
jgi:hypothetical protein